MSAPELTETYRREERTVTLAVRGGKPKSIRLAESEGEAVRVLAGGRLGVACRTGAPSPAAHADLLARAEDAAAAGDPVRLRFPGPEEETAELATFDPAAEAMGAPELDALARAAIERVAAEAPEASLDLDLRLRTGKSELRSTTGLVAEESQSALLAEATLTLVTGGDLVTVTVETGAQSPAGVVDQAITRALGWLGRARTRAKLAPGAIRVVFAAEAVAGLLEPLALGLDGLEAATGSSPLAPDLEREVADRRLSLIEDGLAAGVAGASRRDGEGVPRRRVELISSGVLRSFYHDLRSAAEAGTESTANGLREGGLLPRRMPGAFRVEVEGPLPAEALLREAGSALLVVDLLGIGQGTGRDGSFSYPVALAFAVSGGEVVGRVSDVTISGNVYDCLRDSLVAAGDDPIWTYALGFPLWTPALLLDRVAVSGR